MLDLEDKILEEFKENEDMLEGKITIGCGEFAAVEIMAEICGRYKKKYPRVQIALHTGTADTIYEMMNKGLVDIGLFMEPVDTECLRCRDLRIQSQSRVPPSTGGRIFLCREDWIRRSVRTR